jgi:hypothetical protein
MHIVAYSSGGRGTMRALMMLCLLLCVASVAACASSNSPSQTANPPQQTVSIRSQTSGSAGLRIVPGGGPNVLKVGASIDRVWGALSAVYDSLPVPVALLERRNHVIGNEGFKVRRRLGKTALSKYLECGQSQMEPNADEYEITLAVLSRAVASDSQTTIVTTTVKASAKGLQFAGQFSQCTSTGALETRLQLLLKNALLLD